MASSAASSYVGQIHRTYLICESRDELVIVDQHAAHERVTFERLRQAHRQRQVARQRLLFPIPIEIDEQAMAAVARRRTRSRRWQGSASRSRTSAPKTLLLRAVPDLLKKVDPKPLLLDVLAGMAGDEPTRGRRGQLRQGVRDHGLPRRRARGRRGERASRRCALLVQLDGVDLRSHCPHGRPVLLRMPVTEIEQRLGRT